MKKFIKQLLGFVLLLAVFVPSLDASATPAYRAVALHTFNAIEDIQNQDHLVVGVVELPNGCYQLGEPQVLIAESYPEQVRISVETIQPEVDAICTQALVQRLFAVRYRASERSSLTIQVDGQVIRSVSI
jgi:hypothetical protein